MFVPNTIKRLSQFKQVFIIICLLFNRVSSAEYRCRVLRIADVNPNTRFVLISFHKGLTALPLYDIFHREIKHFDFCQKIFLAGNDVSAKYELCNISGRTPLFGVVSFSSALFISPPFQRTICFLSKTHGEREPSLSDTLLIAMLVPQCPTN